MSEAPVAITAAGVAVDTSGVLSLLEDDEDDDETHAVNLSVLSTAHHSAISGEDIEAMVVPHDSHPHHHHLLHNHHQAQTVSALQQTDEGQSLEDSLVALQQAQHQFSPSQLSPESVSSLHLPSPSNTSSDIPADSMAKADQNSQNSGFGLSSASPHSICLCQAPTRIPRPRNAFILYRQHHHAAVVAQNPGKPNPEISKIIGHMWKTRSDEVKAVWQSHADEEKRQHLQRYPQYRYQPRRSVKKTAQAAAAAVASASSLDPTSPLPALESALCPICGGQTGALPTSPSPVATSGRKSLQASRTTLAATITTARRNTGILDDNGSPVDERSGNTTDQIDPRVGENSGNGMVAGIEALLQLGLRNIEDNAAATLSPPCPSKRRKLNPSPMSPNTTSLSSPQLLQQSLYTTSFGHSSDPSIDFLRTSSFDPEDPPSTALVDSPSGILHNHHIPHYDAQSTTDLFALRADSILEKARAISRICPPLSSMSVPPFGTPSVTRMPIITVDGDDVDLVSDLYHLLSRELEKSPIQQPLYHIDDPDDPLTVLSDAELEGLLDSTGELERDNDADAARYLTHVASWRRKSPEIRSVLMQQQQIVLVNRYVLSRCEVAALRLDTDGLSTLEHWQWCATVWKGCVGADMTIFVVALPDGGLAEEPVRSKDGGKVVFVGKAGRRKEWGGKLMRRLVFDISELVRSLRGFPE
ncbi:hypothetical protein BZA05DRAFT_389804 [Tricharina praecox]|uniref:uncharacterized protein n=1 Tax=Tricharina praecox TaxID=43433 RepID=UPI00221F80F4|nr:uncharacterized protein BZA05DRAFT_389804 [Tricharina praecox]KAI5855829.1 hypothetical protein BZA05DRAFT_389804 [Tricharina praecox]